MFGACLRTRTPPGVRGFFMNYKTYLQSPHWQETRGKKLSAHPYCQICKSTKGLNIHHKKYTHKGQSILYREKKTQLLTLCASCHKLVHKYLGIEYHKLNKRILRIKRLIDLGCVKKMAFICTQNTQLFIATRDRLIGHRHSGTQSRAGLFVSLVHKNAGATGQAYPHRKVSTKRGLNQSDGYLIDTL